MFVQGVQGPAAKGTIFEFPPEKLTKVLPCGKCGREMQVSERTVMAFCGDCSAEMGKKR